MHYKVITIRGKLYKVKRTLPEDRINMIDGWVDVLRTLYHADIVFKQDGILYICETIDDLDHDPIP
jgi:hypothetical protein